MDKLGIIGAEEQEIALLKFFFEGTAKNTAGLEVYDGSIFGKPVVFARSGIGKVAAAMCTQVLISQFGAKAIINSGIAGGLARDLKVLDVVLAEKAVQHDVDASFFGYKLGQVPGTKSEFWTASESLTNSVIESFNILVQGNNGFMQDIRAQSSELSLHKQQLLNDLKAAKLKCGVVATGDAFITSEAQRKHILKVCSETACVEMEGAAIAQVASTNNVPFAILRSISDSSNAENEHERLSYEEFSKRAASMSASIILQLLYTRG